MKTKERTEKIGGIKSVRATEKKYASRAIWIAIGVGLCFFLAGQKPVGKGMILGAIFSVTNFILIGKTLPLRIGKSKRKTFFFSLGSIFFRYVLMALPILVAVKFEQFNLVAAIIGLFMIQIVILADHFGKMISSIRNKPE